MMTFKLLTFFVGALGLVFCFFGYKVQRVYIALMLGLMMGGAGAAIGPVLADAAAGAMGLFGLLGFAIGAYIGYKWFRSMVAFVYGLMGFAFAFLIASILSGDTGDLAPGLIAGIVVGVLVMFLVYKLYKPFVIIASALQGSVMCVQGFSMMIQYDGFIDYAGKKLGGIANAVMGGLLGETTSSASGNSTVKLVFTILLIALGIFFQWKTAGNKLSESFQKFTKSAEQPSGNAPVDAAAARAADNQYVRELYRPFTLPNVENINLYLMLGAVCAVASLLRGGSIVMLLGTLTMAVAVALLLLQNRGKEIPNIAVHLSILSSLILYAVALFTVLANGASIFFILTPIAAIVFLGGFWFAATRQVNKPILFLISGGLAAAQLILYIINNTSGSLELSIILLNLPFMLPALQQYTSAHPAKTNVAVSPQAPAEACACAQMKTDTVFCTQCGSPLRASAMFCTKCGAKVDEDIQ
ncbi:MAG: zinc-ribbon domain-containing protein [Ruthenibacterium sp.]